MTWSVIRIGSPSERTLYRGIIRNHELRVAMLSMSTRRLLVFSKSENVCALIMNTLSMYLLSQIRYLFHIHSLHFIPPSLYLPCVHFHPALAVHAQCSSI